MKKLNEILGFLGFLGVITILWITLPPLPSTRHHCKWPLCPYKDVEISLASIAIREYTGLKSPENGFKVDSIHFVHPDWDYDQIDSSLTH